MDVGAEQASKKEIQSCLPPLIFSAGSMIGLTDWSQPVRPVVNGRVRVVYAHAMNKWSSYDKLIYECRPEDIPGLIEGLDVNEPDQYGSYLLTAACERLQLKTVEFLLSQGANPEVRRADGDTAILCAIDVVHHDPRAASQVVDVLLRAGADIEARGYMDNTPFLKACSRGCLDVLKLLVANGCDIHARAQDGHGAGDSGLELADIFHADAAFKAYLRELYNKEQA